LLKKTNEPLKSINIQTNKTSNKSTLHPVHQLQKKIGNKAVTQLFSNVVQMGQGKPSKTSKQEDSSNNDNLTSFVPNNAYAYNLKGERYAIMTISNGKYVADIYKGENANTLEYDCEFKYTLHTDHNNKQCAEIASIHGMGAITLYQFALDSNVELITVGSYNEYSEKMCEALGFDFEYTPKKRYIIERTKLIQTAKQSLDDRGWVIL